MGSCCFKNACYGSNSRKLELVCASCHHMVAPGWQEHRTRALRRKRVLSWKVQWPSANYYQVKAVRLREVAMAANGSL